MESLEDPRGDTDNSFFTRFLLNPVSLAIYSKLLESKVVVMSTRLSSKVTTKQGLRHAKIQVIGSNLIRMPVKPSSAFMVARMTTIVICYNISA